MENSKIVMKFSTSSDLISENDHLVNLKIVNS